MTADKNLRPQSPYRTGLAGSCPRCGEGRLFNGFITLAERCERCDLDYGFADSGDGPAVFVTLLGGFVLLVLALFVQMTFQPPVWLLMAIFFPVTLVVSVGMLRPLKGLLIALQFHHQAEEGRLQK